MCGSRKPASCRYFLKGMRNKVFSVQKEWKGQCAGSMRIEEVYGYFC